MALMPESDQTHRPAARAAEQRRDSVPTKRGRSSKVTREMILQAALKEFAEHGYEAATTASIARRVGVTQPLIHYHFGSKEALWRSTVDTLFSKLIARLDESETDVDGMGPASRLVALIYSFIDFTVENPELSRLLNTEATVQTPRLTWLIDSYFRPLLERGEGYLDSAKAAGIVKEIPNVFMLFAAVGACHHIFHVAPLVREVYGIDPRSPETASAFANSLVEAFLEGVSAKPTDDA